MVWRVPSLGGAAGRRAGRRLVLAFAGLAPLMITAAQARSVDSDTAAIVARMRQEYDRPDSRLEVSPVAVVDDWALAGWTQGEMGGRALLHFRNGEWVIWLCAGDAIRSAGALRDVGLRPGTADALAARMAAAEAREPPDRVARFARFAGMVRMDPGAGPTRP